MFNPTACWFAVPARNRIRSPNAYAFWICPDRKSCNAWGRRNARGPSRCAAFVVNRVRFTLPAEQVLEACRGSGRSARPEWMRRVRLAGEDGPRVALAPESGWIVPACQEEA